MNNMYFGNVHFFKYAQCYSSEQSCKVAKRCTKAISCQWSEILHFKPLVFRILKKIEDILGMCYNNYIIPFKINIWMDLYDRKRSELIFFLIFSQARMKWNLTYSPRIYNGFLSLSLWIIDGSYVTNVSLTDISCLIHQTRRMTTMSNLTLTLKL